MAARLAKDMDILTQRKRKKPATGMLTGVGNHATGMETQSQRTQPNRHQKTRATGMGTDTDTGMETL